MSEPQHPQAEGAAMNAERPDNGTAAHATLNAYQGPLDSLAAAGARLAQLREAKGWSVDDVSARLKVSPTKMRALEAGDISNLPGTTFALGVVRSYAKMLGTDPTPYTQALRRESGESEPDLSMPASTGTDLPRGRVSVSLGSSTQKHRSSWWWGIGAVVVGLVALVMWHSGSDSSAWFARLKANANGVGSNASGASETMVQGQTVTSAPANGEQGQVAASAPVAASAESDVPASGATLAASESASTASVVSAAAPSSTVQAVRASAQAQTAQTTPAASAPETQAPVAKPKSASAPAAAAASAPSASSSATDTDAMAASDAQADDDSAAPAGASTIAVKVTQDSWFSVRDKSGKEVFSGLVRAGDTKEIAGTPPFKVVAGNRAGLESMTLDGQPVADSKYGTVKDNVVRFSLP
jgi:cytoskeleton protein RodZ